MSRRFHTMNQASRILGVKPHVPRYWEQEFGFKVKRNSAGRRIYSDEQLEKLRLVKHLIHRERLTVKGARRQLARMKPGKATPATRNQRQTLLWLKKELVAIRGLLQPED